MKITQKFLPLGCAKRSGKKIKEIKGFVIHYIGVNQKDANKIYEGWPTSKDPGATQYICDWNNGNIIYTIPENERANQVGADKYTKLKYELVGNDNPNYYFIGVECGIPTIENCKPSEVQWKALVELSADICKRYNLNPLTQIYRHYDITGKTCHRWFVQHPEDWEKFKSDVNKYMKGGYDVMNDNTVSEWAKQYVQKIVDAGIMKGYDNGSFGGKDALTREQICAVLCNMKDKGIINF